MKLMLLSVLLLGAGCSHAAVRHHEDLCRSDGSERSRVFERVANGSTKDLQRTLHSLSCLAGGDLEDAHIAIGVALFRDGQHSEPQLSSSELSNNDLQSIATMLPAKFVDEPCKATRELSRRKQVALSSNQLGLMKQPILDAIEASLKRVKKHCQVQQNPM
jgi:hypothetical protein